MVIANSDSCNTLVSLNADIKRLRNNVQSLPEQSYERTELLLPADDYDYDEWEECDSPVQNSTTAACLEQNLYLPASASTAVDMHLRSIPEVMDSADVLLANPPRCFNEKTRERILYVGQGELAHAVPSQTDVLVSDKATTCHILAFRSTLGNKNSSEPLVSLAHLDSDDYGDCIRGMVQEHKAHHLSMAASCDEEEKKEEVSDYNSQRIDMDVHVVGGFEDEDGSSRKISEFLMNLLARLASEEQSFVRMTLRTCAISSMNDTGHACPIGRGLGVDLVTGEAFLAKVHSSVAGPQQDLRSVRLWASSGANKQISIIHTAKSNHISIAPFCFEAFREIKVLLDLPNHVMIQHTSTSPDVEEDDFCNNVRSTLAFMRDVKHRDVFGSCCDTPVTYRRDGSSNQWRKA